jgi:hypothetical protein
MDSEKYSPEFLSGLALSVLRKDRTVVDLVESHDVPYWVITDSLVKLVQGAHVLMGGGREGVSGRSLLGESINQIGRLCFVHVEKTAGTSLTKYLDDCFPAKEICPALLHETLVELAMTQNLKEFNLLHGHFYLSWLLLAGFNATNTKLITVLRHPLQRQISSYKHWMSDRLSRDHFNHLLGGYNLQCLRLSPLDMRREYASTRDHLEAAKRALEDFFFVGIQERFHESLAALSVLIGRPAPASLPEYKVSKSDTVALPPTLQEEIISANWADVELYEYAIALFDRKFSALSNSANCSEVRDSSWVELSSIEYRMDNALYGSGWHEREGLGGELPQPWRWTGPATESVASFHIKPGKKYRLSIRVVNSLTADILESLQILVNDSFIEVQKKTDDQWGQVFTGTVLCSALRIDAPNMNVTLRVSKTEKFNNVDRASIDDRYCGLAVSEINVTPLED